MSGRGGYGSEFEEPSSAKDNKRKRYFLWCIQLFYLCYNYCRNIYSFYQMFWLANFVLKYFAFFRLQFVEK